MIRVQLLGRFAIYNQDGEMHLPTAKARALAAYLFWKQGEWVRRDFLRGMLWGDVNEERAAGSLRNALHHLRQALETSNDTLEIFEARRDAVKVSGNIEQCIDARIFEQKVREGLPGGTVDITPLVAAIAIYRGDFLDGFDDDWCIRERKRLSDLHIGVLRTLVSRLTDSGLYQASVSYAHRWIGVDSLDEEAHRALMRLYAAMGQPARAAEQFERCRQGLETELGVEPSKETFRLSRQLSLTQHAKPQEGPVKRASSRGSDSGSHNGIESLSENPLRNASLMLIYGEDKALQGDIREGMIALEKALSVYEQSGSDEEKAHAHLMIGSALLYTPIEPQPQQAWEHIRLALEYYRLHDTPANLCRSLVLAADACWETGQYDEALELAREGLELSNALNDKDNEARLSLMMGIALRDQRRIKESSIYFEKVVQSLTCFSQPQFIIRVVFERGVFALLAGDLPLAERLLRETLSIAQMVAPSPKLQQMVFMARWHLIYVLHMQARDGEAREFIPSLSDIKYAPRQLAFLIPIFLPDKDPRVIIKDAESWLRTNMQSIPPNYILPTITILMTQMFETGLFKDAMTWTLVAIRFARCKGWPAWTAFFYATRAAMLVTMGKPQRSRICRDRAMQYADEGDHWPVATVAHADALFAVMHGDMESAQRYFDLSIELYNQMGATGITLAISKMR